jgi:hypothetical protein
MLMQLANILATAAEPTVRRNSRRLSVIVNMSDGAQGILSPNKDCGVKTLRGFNSLRFEV